MNLTLSPKVHIDKRWQLVSLVTGIHFTNQNPNFDKARKTKK